MAISTFRPSLLPSIISTIVGRYENMGRAEVTLLPPAGQCWTESAGWSACPLAPVLAILDGWHSDHTSVSHTARLQTRYLRPGRNQLRIEVLAPEATGPPQGENKFKLLALLFVHDGEVPVRRRRPRPRAQTWMGSQVGCASAEMFKANKTEWAAIGSY